MSQDHPSPQPCTYSSSGGASGKNSVANAGDVRDAGLNPGSGRSPGKGNINPLQYSCLENPIDKRGLVGYSSWGLKELDMNEATQHACM